MGLYDEFLKPAVLKAHMVRPMPDEEFVGDVVDIVNPADVQPGQIIHGVIDSPFGPCEIVVADEAIGMLRWHNVGDRELAAFFDHWPSVKPIRDDKALSKRFADLFEPDSGSLPSQIISKANKAEIKVWKALSRIRFGQAISYGDLARFAGYSNAPRLAASCMGRIPVGWVLPWHRVIGAGGKISGSGENKTWRGNMLARELAMLAN